jgi:hypothetical protein
MVVERGCRKLVRLSTGDDSSPVDERGRSRWIYSGCFLLPYDMRLTVAGQAVVAKRSLKELPDSIHADTFRLKIKQSFAKKREAARAMTD